MTLNKTTLAIVYVGLLFGGPTAHRPPERLAKVR